MLRDLVIRNRSIRRFRENVPVDLAVLHELVDLARLTPSAANRQPLRYLLSDDPRDNQRIFPHLQWAGYLRDWSGPAAGERPAAYVVILGDTRIADPVRWDDAIAAQTMLLGATERGLGGCIIASLDRTQLQASLSLAPHLRVLLVVALGVPAETVVLEDLPADGSIEYWRDAEGVHHVPKRSLDDVIVPHDRSGGSDGSSGNVGNGGNVGSGGER